MLTQRLIESFLVLAETLNYTEAGRRLYLSHQALSRQIMKLEEELGHQLFARSTRSVALTAVGELFYSHFKAEAEQFARVCLDAERLARIQENDLRVGFPLGIRPPAFFGTLVARFRRDRPGHVIRTEWHDVDALTRRFEAGTLDVVFSLDDSGLEVIQEADRVRVASCCLVLAAARDNPAWAGEDLSAFSGQTFYYEQEDSPETTNEKGKNMADILRSIGISEPRMELVPNTESRQTAVELGTGCCLSVELDTMCANPAIRICRLDRPDRYLSCYWRRQTDKTIVPEFIRCFRAALAENDGN